MGNNDDWIAWAVSAIAGILGIAGAAFLTQNGNKPQGQAQPPQQSNVAFNTGTNNPPPKKTPGCGCGK